MTLNKSGYYFGTYNFISKYYNKSMYVYYNGFQYIYKYNGISICLRAGYFWGVLWVTVAAVLSIHVLSLCGQGCIDLFFWGC